MNNQLENTVLRRSQFIGTICNEVELRDFNLKEVADQAEEGAPRHTHQNAHFLLIISGLYITSARNVDHPSSTSTLIFNPAGTTHSDRFQPRGGRFFAVSLKSENLGYQETAIDLMDRPIGFGGGEVSWLGSKLYREFQNQDEVSAMIMTGLALELVGHTLRKNVKPDVSMPPWLGQVQELIHDRFSEPLTVREIAQAVGVHPVYLVRAFRKHNRLTVGEYLRKVRVEFACRQILDSNAPLAHVAVNAGFYDQSHFTRTFKRLTGVTPTKYRSLFHS